jgi:3-hydroxyisobutyrate dehydrogenase
MSADQIGYVGLGNMGGALASRLQLTHSLIVHDINANSVSKMVEQGAHAAEDATDLARRCNVILICLPTSDHVRSVIFGERGLINGLRPGTMIIDQSTGDPAVTRAMAATLADRGVTLIDAPVSGGAKGAEAGTIAIMVGASLAQFQAASIILGAISANIHHAGELGAGQVMKLVNNLVSAAQRIMTIEGVALAAKNGVDPNKACEILLSGGARNAFLQTFMTTHVIKGDLFSGFTLGLMHKDVRLACEMASASGVPLFMGSQTREFYQMCVADQGYDAQVLNAALVMDRLAGTKVIPDI